MATINKIRLTNVIYEDGDKRFNDEVFNFNNNNSAILLENGGGKTVFIHTLLQAVLPHTHLGERKIKDTLQLAKGPAHIGIEWLVHEHPRDYVATVVSLYLHDNQLRSYKYVYSYQEGDADRLENMPFVKNDASRPASKEEMAEYFSTMKSKSIRAETFDTHKSFHTYLEEHYQIIKHEWESIVKINSDEGGIEAFFDHCKTTTDLFDRLLIPTVEGTISGHDASRFANIFEQSRDGFSKYRNFTNSLAEYTLIQEKIAQYVDQFAYYAEAKEVYEASKERAKGIDDFLKKEASANQRVEEKLQRALTKWQADDQDVARQQASYDILATETKADTLQENYLEKLGEKELVEKKRNDNQASYHNLIYAKEKMQLATYQAEKSLYENAQREKDEASNVSDLRDDLEEIDQAIHGHYLSQIESLEKVNRQKTISQNSLQEEKSNLQEKQAREAQAKKQLESKKNQIVGELNKVKRDLNDLMQTALSNPKQDDAQTEYKQWLVRQGQLEEEIMQARNLLHEKKQEKMQLEKEQADEREDVATINLQLQARQTEANHLQQSQEAVIEQLVVIRPTWKSLTDLYLRQSSIEDSLRDLLYKKNKEREAILLKERLAHRFKDDHVEQEYFFTDPVIYERLDSWRNDLVIKTGAEYVVDLPASEQAAARQYKLWPLTLITRSSDLEKLREKIEALQEKIAQPVLLLSFEEAKDIQQVAQTGKWLAPNHWQENIEPASFQAWTKQIAQTAIEVTKEREGADAALNELIQLQDRIAQFFSKYPKEVADQLQEDMQLLEGKKASSQRKLEKLKIGLQQIEETMQAADKEIVDKSDFLNEVEKKILALQEIFTLRREMKSLEEREQSTQENILNHEKSLDRLQEMIARYEEDIEDMSEEIRDNQQEIMRLKDRELYQKVKQTKPCFTEESIVVMQKKRETIDFKIRGLEQAYAEIRAKLEAAEDNINRAEERLSEMRTRYEGLDGTVSFPAHGDAAITRHHEAMRQADNELHLLLPAVAQAKTAYDEIAGSVKTKKERFEKDYPNEQLYVFTIDLEAIPSYLKEQAQTLTERKDYLDKRLEAADREAKNIDQASRKLEKFQEAHQYDRTTVRARALSPEEATAFPYQRLKIVQEVIEELTTKEEALAAEKKQIEQAKVGFRKFCREEITDIKLQQSAIDGMETKDNYEQVLKFQSDMLTSLESASRYARTYIRNNDESIKHFIDNVHNHLRNVVAELKQIPSKTSVETTNKKVEIYRFRIPDWQEEAGRAAIRTHIDWMLKQLEASHFKDDEGKEDARKIRSKIEDWLETKTLLQVVMQNERMRVSCRKVTNDNQITSRLSSWEQSNQWSGGEKWSKNMTLFLGILNFVAEKRQSRPMKRSRAVILDNPFGKASSDHVLNPVFYIAEQLGFQMIALTAHADGKFLQDYFPIIYSLKLREATSDGKQVMTKERHLHHAYFEDHAPEEMSRLEEREQMSFALDEE